MSSNSDITNFFNNQTVFITGATGFLGKVILEKLLRSCEGILKMYVLIREKKNQSSEDRFRDLFNFECFQPLKSSNPEVFQKVHLIYGDCKKPSLGLNDRDINILKSETSCVIHAAASVRFDLPLKETMAYVRATRDLIEIAKEMPNLKSFVFVSTAFSNSINSTIKEEFYKPPMAADKFISFVDAIDEEILVPITPKLLGKYPNTYIYTKCIIEDLIKSVSGILPVSIVRPAIINSAVAEPLPGWIDNLYGPTGALVGVSLGVIRTFSGYRKSVVNMVPVDYVCNVILAVAARKSEKIVFNFAGEKNNLITWGYYIDKCFAYSWDCPTNQAMWHIAFDMRPKFWHKIFAFFLHTCPAYLIDFILLILGKPTMAVKVYEKINKFIDFFSYFTHRTWHFENDNVADLWNNMTDVEQKIFNFDMTNLNWDSYIFNNILKCGRVFLLKESPDTIPQARRKKLVFLILHYLLATLLCYLLYKFIMLIYNIFYLKI